MPYPDYLRGMSEKNAAFVEVRVLGDDNAIVLSGVFPDGFVRRAVQPNGLNVCDSRIEFGELFDETGREILVQQQYHAFDTR